MAKQGITTGTSPNDGTGDTLLAGAVKINSNFDEIYTYFGNGSNLNFTSNVWSTNDTGINTTSKVGIGTTTASEQLTVSGNISLPDDKSSYYGSSNDFEITHNTSLGNEISNFNNNALYINDGTVVNTWFKVDSSGAVFSPAGITSVGAAVTFKGADGSVLARNLKITGVTTSGSFVAGSDVTAAGRILGVGSITGATIHGNGAGLTNIVNSVTAGSGINVSASTGSVTISQSGAQGYFRQNDTGISTSTNVGIGTTTADHTLTVAGVTSTTNLSVTGLSTFSGKMEGAAVNNVIPFYYDNVSEFPSASTYHGAFAHAHNTGRAYFAHAGWKELVNVEANGIVGTGTEKYNIGITSVTALTATTVSASSTITASSFIGDGSGLTGVTASGTGIIIKDGGSLVGTAGTIDFGDSLSVSAISGAAVTVTGTTPTNMTPATLTVAGVTTATGGIEVPDNAIIKIGTGDDLQLYHDVSKSVIADTGTGGLFVAGSSISLTNAAITETMLYAASDGAVELYFDNSKKVSTTNEGLKITGITSTTTLEVNERYGVSTGFGTFVASAGVAHTVDTFTIATNNFKTAEYTLHLEETTNSQTEKVLVMQNGTTAFSNEYAVMFNGNLLVSVGATVAGGAVKLEVTPRSGISGLTTYRFTRETMK